jgi:osmotically-inducible protein OsmY
MAEVLTPVRSDAAIQQDVQRELKWDTRVDETDVGVEVNQGVVTLTGTVSSWGKRTAAVEAAHRVRGVLDIADDIVVRPPGSPGRSDTEIAAAVRHALAWDVFVPAARIRCTVSGGVVTLDGGVGTWTEHDDAERAVKNLAGVREVRNRVAVEAPRGDAASVRRAVQDALRRHAAQEAAAHVTVELTDGTVRLLGVVRTWAEKQAMLAAARMASGARPVEDEVRVDPYL